MAAEKLVATDRPIPSLSSRRHIDPSRSALIWHPTRTTMSERSVRVWVDGDAAADGARAISAFDRGLTLGDGVFEAMRVLNGVAPLLDRHLARLQRGVDRLGLVLPADFEAHIAECAKSAKRLGLGDAVLRLTLTRGDALPGLAGLSGGASRSIVSITPRIAPREDVVARGLSLIVSQWRWSAKRPTAGIKSLDYTGNVLALREAHGAGADDALLLDTRDMIMSCSASNIAWISGTQFFTPHADTGALEGTTLGVLRELAPGVGLEVVDAEAGLSALVTADAALACSAIRGVVPIASLDSVSVGSGARSPRLRALHDAWRAEMARRAGVDFVAD
jgi:branched-chain amino acid aminotransferase